MKKTISKSRLLVTRESIAILDDRQITKVNGGVTGIACQNSAAASCLSECQPLP